MFKVYLKTGGTVECDEVRPLPSLKIPGQIPKEGDYLLWSKDKGAVRIVGSDWVSKVESIPSSGDTNRVEVKRRAKRKKL